MVKLIFPFILSLFFLTGCYTQVKMTYPVKQPRYEVTHLLAINSSGDTTRVHINDFRLLYDRNPTLYSDWRIYWDRRWISPHSYYRYYYRPYQPIYVYYPYPSWNIQSGNQRPQPKVETPSQPRRSGVTSSPSPQRGKSTTGRTTGRSGEGKEPIKKSGEQTRRVQRVSTNPDNKKSETTHRGTSTPTQRKRDN